MPGIKAINSRGDYILNAPPYRTAIGISGSLNSGITIKKFFRDEMAVEAVLGTRWRGISLTGIYEICIAGSSGFSYWNFGMGPRLGMYNGKYHVDYLGLTREDRVYSMIGLVATFGVELCFDGIPLSFGLDYRPFVDFKGQDDTYLDGVFSFRYTF